jgi:hypothetical protein
VRRAQVTFRIASVGRILAHLPKQPSARLPNMPNPANELIAKILRLQAQRDDLIYILETGELSDEQRAQVENQLLTVQDELLQLKGGISEN